MKFGVRLIFLAFFVVLFANFSVANGVDEQCEKYGFDFGIAKYECDGEIEEGSEYEDYNIDFDWVKNNGECEEFKWASDTFISGMISKEGQIINFHNGSFGGNIGRSDIYAISHITFCKNGPTCGDGIVEQGEECELPNTATCDSNCMYKELTCVEAKDLGLLTGVIIGDKGFVTNSWHQSYDVGLATYEEYDNIIDNQKLYDSKTGVVPALGNLTLSVGLPMCKYQIDLFCGPVLPSLDGVRYGNRIIDANKGNYNSGYCEDLSKNNEGFSSFGTFDYDDDKEDKEDKGDDKEDDDKEDKESNKDKKNDKSNARKYYNSQGLKMGKVNSIPFKRFFLQGITLN